jgi:SET domain-containing protein
MSRNLRIGKATGKGLGVFAVADIQANRLVTRYRGKTMWIWDISKPLWDHCFQVDYDQYVVPRRDSIGWYLNHSCEPNCAIRGERDIVTLRRIAQGEELTFDYSTNVGWEGFGMRCACGSRKCRGLVTCYDYLDEGPKRRYGSRVSLFLLRRHKGLKR